MSWLSAAWDRNRTAIAGIAKAIPVVGGVASAIIGQSKPAVPTVSEAIRGVVDRTIDNSVVKAQQATAVLQGASAVNNTAQQVIALAANPLVWLVAGGVYLVARGRR